MNSGNPNDFGKRIRQLRDRLGLSAPKFAAQIGFDRSYIFRLESGAASNPSLKFIEAVIEKFGVDREWLFSGVGDGSSLRLNVVPHRSGLDGYTQMRLECLQTIIDACTDIELNKAFARFKKLAEEDDRLGKIFAQVADVISCTILRRTMKKDPRKKSR